MSAPVHHVRFTAPLTGVTLACAAVPGASTDGANPAPPHARHDANDSGAAGNVANLISELVDRVDELESRRREIADELHHIAVDLAVAVSEKVLLQQLDAGTFPVADMVASMLEQTQWSGPVTVILNPADLKLLEQQLAGTQASLPDSPSVVADPGFPRGRVHVTAGDQGTFYDTSLQLAEIRQRLLEKLDEAEIERRIPRASDSELRRFPDRRATG